MDTGENILNTMLTKLKYTDRERDRSELELLKNSPRGDFNYDSNVCQISSDCSSTDFQDEIHLNQSYQRIEEQLESMEEAMKQTLEEVEDVGTKVEAIQDDLLNRRDLFKEFIKFKREQVRATVEYTEKNEKIDFMIKNLEDKIQSRQCFINEYLRVE